MEEEAELLNRDINFHTYRLANDKKTPHKKHDQSQEVLLLRWSSSK